MKRLLDTDPVYHFSWKLIPFNGTTEHEFEWNLKVASEYLPLGEKGFTEEELDKLNAYFNKSEYKNITQLYTLSNSIEKYNEFHARAGQITQEIIKKAL